MVTYRKKGNIMKRVLLVLTLILLFATACGGPNNQLAPSVADLSTCDTTGTASQSTDPKIEQLRQAMLDFRNALQA